MIDKQTSDERLLKIIEGAGEPKKPSLVAAGAKKFSLHVSSAKLGSFDLKSKLKDLKMNLQLINKGLIALAAVLTFIFLYVLISGLIISKPGIPAVTSSDNTAILKLISAGEAQGLMRKSIINQDLRRNFFLPFGVRDTSYVQDEEPDIAEELKALKLVGIIWSKNPEVMIENSKDSRTYTLRKGEVLNNQFKIKEITRNSAVLVSTLQTDSKEYELR